MTTEFSSNPSVYCVIIVVLLHLLKKKKIMQMPKEKWGQHDYIDTWESVGGGGGGG